MIIDENRQGNRIKFVDLYSFDDKSGRVARCESDPKTHRKVKDEEAGR
jgi:hypothetical protein